jgi:hypothetical protein
MSEWLRRLRLVLSTKQQETQYVAPTYTHKSIKAVMITNVTQCYTAIHRWLCCSTHNASLKLTLSFSPRGEVHIFQGVNLYIVATFYSK